MWMFWQHNKKKDNFQTKHYEIFTVCDAAAVRSSTASSFNKCFFMNSPWHCASFTKQNSQINPQTRSRRPLKKTNHLFLVLGTIWYLYQVAFNSIMKNIRTETVKCLTNAFWIRKIWQMCWIGNKLWLLLKPEEDSSLWLNLICHHEKCSLSLC